MRCGYECISGGCKEGSEQARWGLGLGLGLTLTLTLTLALTLTLLVPRELGPRVGER